MRQSGKHNRQRGRGRRNGNGQINRNTTIDSNGPDVRLRGNAFQLHEKYTALGNDAAAAGERISAEAYYQYADHYFRVHSSITVGHDDRRERTYDNPSTHQAPQSPQAPQDKSSQDETSQAKSSQEGSSQDGAENSGADEKSSDTDEKSTEDNAGEAVAIEPIAKSALKDNEHVAE